MPAPDLTPAAIAARIAPGLIDQLEARKPDLIAKAGGPIKRALARDLWPTAMAEIPTLIEAVAAALLDEFGRMTVQELAAAVFAIKQAKAAREGRG